MANTAQFFCSDFADVDVSKFYADPYRCILSDALLREEKT